MRFASDSVAADIAWRWAIAELLFGTFVDDLGGVDGASEFSPLNLGFSSAGLESLPATASWPAGLIVAGGALNIDESDAFLAKVCDAAV